MSNILRAWNQEWRSANAGRNYPLADDATAADVTGTFRLPTDFLVGMDLPVRADDDIHPGSFFVRQVVAATTGFRVTVAVDTGSGVVDVAVATVPVIGHARGTAYTLAGVEDFDDSLGYLLVDRLDGVLLQPAGIWDFDQAGGRLDPDAIRPQLRGVGGVVLVNGDQRSPVLRGVIELQAGGNARWSYVLNDAGATVRLDFVSGEGTVEDCGCDDSAVSPPVRTIGAVAPTPDGDFYFVGTDCLQLTPIQNGLQISDTCAKPCCSCPELEAVTADLDRLMAEAGAVSAFGARLETSVRTAELVMLSSRLGGCST